METDENAIALHKESIIIDGLEISNWSRNVFENMRKGGLTAVNATVALTAVKPPLRMFSNTFLDQLEISRPSIMIDSLCSDCAFLSFPIFPPFFRAIYSARM